MAHIVHSLPPPAQGTVQTFFGTRLGLSARLCASGGLEALEAGVLNLADGIVKVELGGKVPLAIVGMLTANVVGMKG